MVGTGQHTSIWSAITDGSSWNEVGRFLTNDRNHVLFVGSMWVGAALGLGFSHWLSQVTDPYPEPAPPPFAFRIAIFALVFFAVSCLLARGADEENAKGDGTCVEGTR